MAFDVANDCVDTFLGTFLHGQKEYARLWKVCLFVFVLSPGQSAVERGFSVNENMLVKNLSLIGQQMVYDHMFSQKIKLESYEPPLDLIKSCSKAYIRYAEALKSCAALKKEEEVSRKRKLAMEDIAEVKQRKANIEECIGRLGKEADELSIQAEKKQDFLLLLQKQILFVLHRKTSEMKLSNLRK